MYVIDARHFLNEKGDIGPERGPGRKMADFVTAVIAHESDFDRPDTPGPVCFKCRKGPVDTLMTDNEIILWRCPPLRHRRQRLELAEHILGCQPG